MSSISERFDNFLYGAALANHAHYLSENWEEDHETGVRVAAYFVGMGEHVLYAMYKVVLIVGFLFINLALAAHYGYSLATGTEEATLTNRKYRLYVGLLILGEAIPALLVDAGGIVCPPAAYRVHMILKDNITRRCFEKMGIIEHSLPPEQFQVMDYWTKV